MNGSVPPTKTLTNFSLSKETDSEREKDYTGEGKRREKDGDKI